MAMDCARLRRRTLENSLTAYKTRHKQEREGLRSLKGEDSQTHSRTDPSLGERRRKSLARFPLESHIGLSYGEFDHRFHHWRTRHGRLEFPVLRSQRTCEDQPSGELERNYFDLTMSTRSALMLSYRTCEAVETRGFSARACKEGVSTRDEPHGDDEPRAILLDSRLDT